MSKLHKAIRDLIAHTSAHEPTVTSEEITEGWADTVSRALSVARRNRRRYTAAAAIGAAAVVGALLWLTIPSGTGLLSTGREIELYALRTPASFTDGEGSSVKLLMAGGTEMLIDSPEALIDHDASGSLVIDHDSGAAPAVAEQAPSDAPVYNQVIVPYGRRSRLTMADGTRMWLNSGSRVVYPAAFASDSREIYLEGEAYLEVARDTSRPFTVKTSSMNIRVTGTRFNVFAYPGEARHEVALVQGGVTVRGSSAGECRLTPGHAVSSTAGGDLGSARRADVTSRISWVTNTLIYDDEPLQGVFERLRLYYGKQFVMDAGLDHIHITGKLDMPGSLESILESIAFSVPVTFEHAGGDTIRVHSLK